MSIPEITRNGLRMGSHKSKPKLSPPAPENRSTTVYPSDIPVALCFFFGGAD